MGTIFRLHFTLTGKFDPDVATREIGLNPTKVWRFNEKIQNTKLKHKQDGWRISSEEVESINVGEHINGLIEKIFPFKKRIVGICQSLELNPEISCEMEINEDQYPIIHFDKETIQKIFELGAEIDLDLY